MRGRPVEYPDKRITFAVRLSAPMLEALKAEAARREVSANRLVCAAVERALREWQADPLHFTGEAS